MELLRASKGAGTMKQTWDCQMENAANLPCFEHFDFAMMRLRSQVKIDLLVARMRLSFFAAMFAKVRMRIQVWGGSQEEEVAGLVRAWEDVVQHVQN